MDEYYVYILRCGDESYYTGVTNDHQARVYQHLSGSDPSCYTFKRRPLELVYIAEFCDVQEAIAWEKRVKKWSRRKKENLIFYEGKELPLLACMAQDWQIAMGVRSLRFLVMVSLTNHDKKTH